jgi:polygalacturonase
MRKHKKTIIGESLPNIPREERSGSSSQVLWRYSKNPVIPRDLIPCANSIFNSAVVPFGKTFGGVFRVDDQTRAMCIHNGRSKDGLHFEIDPVRRSGFPAATLTPLLLSAIAALVLVTASGCASSNVTQSERSSHPGFVPDGVTMNTAAINAAIVRLSEAGGGTLSFPPGRYLTGTIYLKSGVTLHLENGAVIVGSTNIADYPKNQPPFPSKTLEFGRYSLIYAGGQHDLAITGGGKIYGRGSSPNFTKKDLQVRGLSTEDVYQKRPFGLCFVGCRRVQVRNVTLQDTAFWTEDYLDCDDVVVDGVTVDNRKDDYNNDGIDVDGSRNVRISNCHIVAGDDGVCLKSSYAACENITVSNCVIRTLCNGFKCGTASRGGFKNISVANCTIFETGAAGIALEIVDGGVLDGVTVTNISMNDVGTPIFIRLGNRAKAWIDGQEPASPGILRNVVISAITATLATKDGTGASSISGLPGHPVENVTIRNVKIVLTPGYGKVPLDAFQLKFQTDAKKTVERDFGNEVKRVTLQDVPERPLDYPEFSMFGALPAYGFFCRHANNLTFDHINLGFDTAEYRSALAMQDVRGCIVDGLRAKSSPESNPVVLLRDVTDAMLTRCVAQAGTPTFLRVEGDSDHISILESDLSRAASAVSLESGLENRHIGVGPGTDVTRASGR